MSDGLSSVIGDPSLNGWATFLVYIVVGWLCFENARRSAGAAVGGRVALIQARRRFWSVTAALLLVLGLSRQLDLQNLLAQLARGVLRSDGLYEARSALQVGMVIAIGIFGSMGLLIALFMCRRAEGSILAAAAGAALLIIFTIIRTISLHDIEQLLAKGVPHARVNNLIEIGALVAIALPALIFARQLRHEAQSDRLRGLTIAERRRQLGQKRRSGES